MSSWKESFENPDEVVRRPKAGVATTVSELEQMYNEQRMTVGEIADEFDVARATALRLMRDAGIERRDTASTSRYAGKKYRDKEWLKRKFVEEDVSNHDIAEICDVTPGCINNWIRKFDLREDVEKCSFHLSGYAGNWEYPTWGATGAEADQNYLRVHQLVAIADGEDPYKVFSDEYHVHHRNHFKCDNRPSNLELVDTSTHGKYHSSKPQKWTDDDLRFAIQFMMNMSRFD